jgi:hypothetical protein
MKLNKTSRSKGLIMGALEEKILNLLGSGIAPVQVSSACGVTESYISQLMGDEDFRAKVIELRYENLSKHNERDNNYDRIEDKLLQKLEQQLPMMFKPMEVLKALQVINAAKRRGQSAPESIVNQQNIINIVMPTQIINKFRVNSNNQVISAGSQDLVTMQSGALLKQLKGLENESSEQLRALPNSASITKATA